MVCWLHKWSFEVINVVAKTFGQWQFPNVSLLAPIFDIFGGTIGETFEKSSTSHLSGVKGAVDWFQSQLLKLNHFGVSTADKLGCFKLLRCLSNSFFEVCGSIQCGCESDMGGICGCGRMYVVMNVGILTTQVPKTPRGVTGHF